MVFESTGAFDVSTGQVLQQLARGVAARAGGDASELHGQLLQELYSIVRTFRARTALRRRVELGENTGVAAAAVVLRAPADESWPVLYTIFWAAFWALWALGLLL